MADVNPPDYTTAVGKVRALIPDTEMVDWEGDGDAAYLFSDGHLTALLALYPEADDDADAHAGTPRLRRAAADAVEAIATSEALISKVIKTEDLQTDGAKLANALNQRAAMLRRTADKEEADLLADEAFTVVDFEPARPTVATWPPRVGTTPHEEVWTQL